MADFEECVAGTLADRYAIHRELGHGGMAIVYLAVDGKPGSGGAETLGMLGIEASTSMVPDSTLESGLSANRTMAGKRVVGVIMLRAILTLIWTFTITSVLATPGHAQRIPRGDYIRFLPLEYPRIVRQTDASAKFAMYGDVTDPAYRDVDPIDGIDDERHRVLRALVVRFAPLMVQNTSSVPMDVKFFFDSEPAFPMRIDTWEMARSGGSLVKSETIDFASLGAPCPTSAPAEAPLNGDSTMQGSAPQLAVNDDCRLLAILEEFDPVQPTNVRFKSAAVDADEDPFRVMYFDMPGYDEASWKAEYVHAYSRRLRREYQGFAKVYAHPFIHEVRSNTGGVLGYEFVLQYWFYYPFNDGGNNHEGDWEHINVVIAPIERVTQPLAAEHVRRILSGDGSQERTGEATLVLSRVEYFFHHQVMILDYGRPNAYLPHEAWRREVRAIVDERVGEEWVWGQIRRRAYEDAAETRINTHPIAYIGADNKGLDQLIAMPGSRNRDSHGTFPFPGLYKDVGPTGSAEQIPHYFDHTTYFRNPAYAEWARRRAFHGGHMEPFDDSSKVEVIPDWERVIDLVRSDPVVRRDWSWLVVPVRWGYPATTSPLAGIVAHAETGNLGPVGPAYNKGWNRVGAGAGFELYAPHKLPSFFPTAVQDGFSNQLGFLNAPATLINLPPFDLLWRIAALPFRAVFKRQDPSFFPEESVPPRFLGVGAGVAIQFLPDEFSALFLHTDDENRVTLTDSTTGFTLELPIQFIEYTLRVLEIDSIALDADTREDLIIDDPVGMMAQLVLYLGKRFSSENTLRHFRSTVGIEFGLVTRREPLLVTADLNFWEYVGSLRYNIATGNVQPFVKGGYGLSWYRLENTTADGTPLENPDYPWIRRPSLFENLWPNTWHYGFGLEFLPIQSFAAIPKGLDVGLRVEYLFFRHSLGLQLPSPFGSDQISIAGVNGNPTVTRRNVNFAVTVTF